MDVLLSPTLDPAVAASAPPRFHLLAKPSGSTCNIDCTYCFFLSKESLYPNDKHRMSEATLEAYIRQLLESHRTPQVTVAWQGGEPSLMKLEFFRRAVELVEKHRQPGQTVQVVGPRCSSTGAAAQPAVAAHTAMPSQTSPCLTACEKRRPSCGQVWSAVPWLWRTGSAAAQRSGMGSQKVPDTLSRASQEVEPPQA